MNKDLVLPDTFLQTIRITFGADGLAWLSRLPDLLAKISKCWGLGKLSLMPDLSYNLILSVRSFSYGDAVLKIGVPCDELSCEINYLRLYGGAGNKLCRCYQSDPELGAMLLERIFPGENLFSVPDVRQRIGIGMSIIASLPKELSTLSGNANIFPRFRDWMERTFLKVESNRKADAYVYDCFNKARSLYDDLTQRFPKTLLIHGDLHHMNMLRNSSGGWTVIDPKGVLAPPVMEAARFIRNQLWKMGNPEKDTCMRELLALAAKAFETEERVVAHCVFIDTALSGSWDLEGEMDDEKHHHALQEAVAEMEFSSRYL